MDTITEAELVENAKDDSVVCIKAVKSIKGKGFNLLVNLSWKKGDLLLITQKRRPRNWVSTDRMLSHIEKNYRKVDTILILLRGHQNDE